MRVGIDSLLKDATHCEAPDMPPLARQSRIKGDVLVDILVNDKGKVFCMQRVTGHPMLAGSATDAAKKWTFLPKTQNGRDVWFYGRLRFRFSKGDTTTNSCTIADDGLLHAPKCCKQAFSLIDPQ